MRAGDVTTVPLSDLQPGDEILLLLGGGSESTYVALKPIAYDRSIMSMTLNTDVTLPTYLTEDIAYFLGYLHADGYVHVGKKVTWSAPKALKLATADAHPSIRERLDRIVKTQFGLTAVHEQGDGAVVNLGVYSRLLIEWLRDNGLLKDKSELARVPEAIFRSPSSVMGAFIAGYFDADGCNRGKKGGFRNRQRQPHRLERHAAVVGLQWHRVSHQHDRSRYARLAADPSVDCCWRAVQGSFCCVRTSRENQRYRLLEARYVQHISGRCTDNVGRALAVSPAHL
ncbi:MAG: hypothetical protein HND48_23950 [Chloroflexi bacterium]|nr:hypothetical protein [Chloroflexota bacterium]